MKTLSRLGGVPAAIPILADDLVEFHAVRILLLLETCGTKGRIDGMTKLAKLDFFVRYPAFFEVAASEIEKRMPNSGQLQVESSMIRYRYGPWDKRYYDVLGFLVSRGLVVIRNERSFTLALSPTGRTAASEIARKPAFSAMIEHMKKVKKEFGAKSGTSLKKLIYETFEEEVGSRQWGETIRPEEVPL